MKKKWVPYLQMTGQSSQIIQLKRFYDGVPCMAKTQMTV